jgi:hypothetical protein
MWDIIDKLATIIGLISVIIAAWNAWKLRRETKRQWQKENEQICVILRSTSRQIKLTVELKRGGFTRAELLGLIGMLPLPEGKTRFALDFPNTHVFSQQLVTIRDSDVDFEFIVPCKESELDQFTCDKTPIPSTNMDS